MKRQGNHISDGEGNNETALPLKEEASVVKGRGEEAAAGGAGRRWRQGGRWKLCPTFTGCPAVTPNQPHQPLNTKRATPTPKPTAILQDWKTKYNILIGFPKDLPDGYSEWLARSVFCLVAPGGCGPGVDTVWAGVGKCGPGVGRCGRLHMRLTSICHLSAEGALGTCSSALLFSTL